MPSPSSRIFRHTRLGSDDRRRGLLHRSLIRRPLVADRKDRYAHPEQQAAEGGPMRSAIFVAIVGILETHRGGLDHRGEDSFR